MDVGGHEAPPATDSPPQREVRYRYSPSLVEVLRRAECALLVSTYQAGKLVAVGTEGDELRLSFHEFDQAMGVAVARERVAVGARGQIWFLADSTQIAPQLEPRGRYDRCYLPRSTLITGVIHCHELAWGVDSAGHPELWIVNTLFSCLANPHEHYNFVPRWRPPFVSALASEDRCHLNGLGMRDGRPAYVTAMACTDTDRGWRADKNHTGCVLDVGSGEPVTTGLAMPHSPRWHRDRLLVLNSGRGTLEAVELGSGNRTTVETLPGFTRGLACHGSLAFVGLSKIRETAVFGGVPVAEKWEELRCGVGVVDLQTGRTIATLEFESGIEEIFDVQVVPGARCVAFGGDELRTGRAPQIWLVPSESQGPPAAQNPPHAQAPALAPTPRQAAQAANTRGNALQDTGDQEAALTEYRRAAAIDPGFAPALQNLGYLLVNLGRTGEGVEHLRRAQQVTPLDVNRLMIATALPIVYASSDELAAQRERLEASVQQLVDEGVRIDTTDALVPTNFFAAYQGADDRALHENLGRIFHGPDLTEAGPGSPGSGHDGRLRVGFLSAYFHDHTIGRLNLGRLQHLDRDRFELVVLYAGARRDPVAEAFERTADRFLALPRQVAAARRAIADQRLDALVFADVGMDALTYTLAFSRMAPVQCATWGHPVTTGSPAIDYFISSELLEGERGEQHYSERLLRLPSLGIHYSRPQPPQPATPHEELGLPPGATLYACPQTLFKFHPDFDPLLAEILRRDPRGHLILIEGRTATWTRLLQERFARTMPDVSDRIHWLPAMPREAFLRLLAGADVALDPTRFGGGNTSYETLAVSTPLVTLPRELMRTRITQALYRKAGYHDLIAGSETEYVELAVKLGTDPEFRQAAAVRIAETSEVLYDDLAEVRDLETFLTDALLAG